jgi:hypothetical protein
VDILVCIDDTDDVETRGTGEIAELLARGLEDAGLARCGRVTRHQLLVHPDIAYTSHNSSMCFPAEIEEERLLGSLARPRDLVGFGRDAKTRVLTKADANRAAAELGVHLSEHGGSGLGVIGALAGAGLRLSGDDGRFRGKFRIPGDARGVASVREIKALDVDDVRVIDGATLADEERVLAGEDGKLVLLGGKAVLLVRPAGQPAPAPWTLVDRRSLKAY